MFVCKSHIATNITTNNISSKEKLTANDIRYKFKMNIFGDCPTPTNIAKNQISHILRKDCKSKHIR